MQVDATLTLDKLTVRTEKHGDEDKPAITIKWRGEVPEEEAKNYYSTPASFKRLLAPLWNKDDELTTSDVKSMPLNSVIEGGTAVIATAFGEKIDLGQVRVDAVVLTPMAGRKCEVIMNMAAYPDSESLWFLYEHQKKSLQVTCSAGQLPIDDTQHDREPGGDDRPEPQDGDLPLGNDNASDEGNETDPFAGMGAPE
jgi:hypothetical protein